MDIQWNDIDPETGQKRFVCAEKFAKQWRFKVRFKRREDWAQNTPPTLAMWEELLDAIERRYPRREGVDETDLAMVKKIVAEWREKPITNLELIE